MAISTIGTASRNYVDIDAWLADLPATLLQQEIAEMYNDSEFTTSAGIVISGIATTPTFNMIIRPATGEAFNDTEQALRYNQTSGVGIRKTTNYGTILYINGVDNITVENMQIVGGMFRVQPLRISDADNTVIRGNVLQGTTNQQLIRSFLSPGTEIINNAIVNTANESSTGILLSGANWKVVNNTLISLFSASMGLVQSYGAATTAIVKNNTVFNYSTPIASSTWNTTNVDFNATDSGTIEGGSNNLTSLTIADQFEDLTLSTLDLRLKTGNDLDGSGTPESSFTNDLDIFFNARSLTSPSIGAYETVSGGGGISLSVTEVLNPFSDSSIVNIDANVSIAVTETLNPFTDSSTINVTPAVSIEASVTEVLNSFSDSSVIAIVEAGNVALNVTETLSAFTDSSVLNISANVNVNITEVLNSFLDGSNVTIAKDISIQVTEVLASFTDNSFVRMPTAWVDKTPESTTYTIKPPVTTNWTDKG